MLSSLFPPTILQDLNFFTIDSPTAAEFRLRTLRRVIVAALGGYLFMRYSPVLQAQITPIPYLSRVPVAAISMLAGYILSAPSTFLAIGGYYGWKAFTLMLDGQSDAKRKIVYGTARVFVMYAFFQFYKDIKLVSDPNFLEKKLSQTRYERWQLALVENQP